MKLADDPMTRFTQRDGVDAFGRELAQLLLTTGLRWLQKLAFAGRVFGSRTTVNQKPSMARTLRKNSSSSTGFVM